jgi:glycosyltransferase involved in cell wall biosynthesis
MANITKKGIEYLQEPIKGVSVIIPSKNEENAVRLTIEDVIKALDPLGINYEIIVVDDGSTDRTREEALAAGARVLVHSINKGYGNAIMNGMKIANFPVIAIMDADGTYPASMLPAMIEEASRHDMVVGSRLWTGENTSLLGRFFRKALFFLILYFSNVKAKDYNSGFRVFHKLNALDYRPVLCPTFSFTTTLTLLYLLTAKSVLFLPIEYARRIGSSKVSYIRDAVRTFSYVFAITSLFQPYRLSLIIIFIGILLNSMVILCALLFDFGYYLQAGLHVIASLSILIGAVAINTYPIAHLYLDHLHEKWKNEPQ